MARQLSPLANIPAWRRGWTRYHLIIVSLFAALLFGAILRAVLVYDSGGWETEAEVELPWSAEAVWPLVSSAKGREAWQSGVSDILLLKRADGVVGTTHSTWYVKDGVTWRGREEVMAWVPGRLFRSYTNSEIDERNFTVELETLGPCKTRVRVKEVASLKLYADRYAALWEALDEDSRALKSMSYLEKTAAKSLPDCTGQN